ncbi:tRNA (adenine(22)-N(1))-methyltransferase [Bombilactobacillus thymidiniphilus]|uniref:Class I SAM-dependent methyltransferase n=1 Tax=Bombilactobacillus thymidiniphilus TaxID=2923363 RepID=A0ABY4PD23_9LACO|nr:class I SAM-dependent methyltransferase [Bombilactobacillus thymidiniphilus]UQS83549.1 class I SAM-dependent methyltransferase [Bombilactobacillus thymidiniphilus]
MIKLSRRLQAIADLVTGVDSMIDVGSDHAFVPIYLVQQQKVQTAIASEVSSGPLNISKKDIHQEHLDSQIKTRLGDGLTALKTDDQVDLAVVAGMGGQLITDILKKGQVQLQTIDQLVLEPNNDEACVRKWLTTHQYQITQEKIILEGKHIYEIIAAKRGRNEQLTNEQLIFGPKLMLEKNAVFMQKWQWQLTRNQQMLQQLQQAKILDQTKIAAVNERIKLIEGIL